MDQEAIISVKDLRTYFYSDKRCNKVLNGISFELYKGRIYLAAGPVVWATELYLYDLVDKNRNYASGYVDRDLIEDLHRFNNTGGFSLDRHVADF